MLWSINPVLPDIPFVMADETEQQMPLQGQGRSSRGPDLRDAYGFLNSYLGVGFEHRVSGHLSKLITLEWNAI